MQNLYKHSVPFNVMRERPMKYLIWGAGARGRRMSPGIPRDDLVGFVDKDREKQGTMIDSVPVFSPEEGLCRYPDAYVLISLSDDRDVVAWLEQEKRTGYAHLRDIPSAWRAGCQLDITDIPFPLMQGKNIGIYGVNPWGIWIAEHLCTRGMQVFLIPDDGEKEKAAFVSRVTSFEIRTSPQGADMVFVTNHQIARGVSRFPEKSIEDFMTLADVLPRFYHPDLKQFQNIHQGERVFLIGTGPSLRFSDLAKLHRAGALTIGVNQVFRGFPQTDWRPDYYVMNDPAGIRDFGDELKKLELPHLFISDMKPSFWTPEVRLLKRFHEYHAAFYYPVPDQLAPFSKDICKVIYSIGTVMYDAVQIAAYMGFSEIYLLGVDCSYQGTPGNEENHFIKNYYHAKDVNTERYGAFSQDETFQGYQSAKIYAAQHGIQIFNATRGGALEVFPRVDFDSLF